ncbi:MULTISPECIES: hypothetical protein [unclassified Mesorhizobium]|uniref:hypothetical protein n=1 Tax=unclassified Mesorhizobium TaxID=325217 RepID=UPI003014C05B
MTDAERIEQLEYKVGEAYQVVGWLLTQCGLFETKEGQRALDYFSRDEFDDNFLPWPRSIEDFPEK